MVTGRTRQWVKVLHCHFWNQHFQSAASQDHCINRAWTTLTYLGSPGWTKVEMGNIKSMLISRPHLICLNLNIFSPIFERPSSFDDEMRWGGGGNNGQVPAKPHFSVYQPKSLWGLTFLLQLLFMDQVPICGHLHTPHSDFRPKWVWLSNMKLALSLRSLVVYLEFRSGF